MNLSIKKAAGVFMQKTPNPVSRKIGRSGLILKKHSPTILFASGLVGIVTTVVLASRATLKMDEVLSEAQKDIQDAKNLESEKYSEKEIQREMAVVYAKASGKVLKLYAPAVFIGLASVCALTGSHIVLTRRNVGLTAAYAAIEKGYNEYRRRVIEEFGEDKERELRHGYVEKQIVEETEEGPLVSTVKRVDPNTVSQYAKFFDQMSKNWNREPEYNHMFLRCQETNLNLNLRTRGHVFLNEVYDALDIPRTQEGSIVGWLYEGGDGDGFIDFGLWDGTRESVRDFVNGHEGAILLDFNPDGNIWDKI